MQYRRRGKRHKYRQNEKMTIGVGIGNALIAATSTSRAMRYAKRAFASDRGTAHRHAKDTKQYKVSELEIGNALIVLL